MSSGGLLTALVLSAAVGSGAYMLTRTEMFAPLPAWAFRRAGGARSYRGKWLWTKAGSLLMCPYCTGTWLAMGAVLVYRPVLVSVPYIRPGFSFWPLGFLVSVLVINGSGMLWVLVIRLALGK